MTPEPGHYSPGADTNHFLGRCEECDVHYMSHMSLEKAENWYRQGVLSQDQMEAFLYVWATSAYRYGTYPLSWSQAPENPDVLRLVTLMQALTRGKVQS